MADHSTPAMSKASVKNAWYKVFTDWRSQSAPRLDYDAYGCAKLDDKNFKRILGFPWDVVVFYYENELEEENLSASLMELAAEYNNNPSSPVVIAAYNVAKYVAPADVYASPTIRLYPVNEKNRSMRYFGDPGNAEKWHSWVENSKTRNCKPVRRNTPPEGLFGKLEKPTELPPVC